MDNYKDNIKTTFNVAVGKSKNKGLISAVDWKMVVSSAIVAGVVSVLTSLAGIPEVEEE